MILTPSTGSSSTIVSILPSLSIPRPWQRPGGGSPRSHLARPLFHLLEHRLRPAADRALVGSFVLHRVAAVLADVVSHIFVLAEVIESFLVEARVYLLDSIRVPEGLRNANAVEKIH